MAALTAPRSTSKLNPLSVLPMRFGLGVKSTFLIYEGAVVVADPANGGYAYPGKAGLGLAVVGIANATADATAAGPNSVAGAAPADGTVLADVITGVFALDNSTGVDLITAANFGQPVYLVDDHTVALTDGGETRSFAGTFCGFADDGVSPLVLLGHAMFAAGGATGGSGAPRIQTGTVTLVAGTKTVNTGIELTAASVVIVSRKLQGGTVTNTVQYEELSGSRVVGIPGVATLVFQASVAAGTVANTDTSTLEYTIIG